MCAVKIGVRIVLTADITHHQSCVMNAKLNIHCNLLQNIALNC